MLVRWSQALGVIVITISCGGLLFFHETAPAQVPATPETPQAVQAGAHLFRQNCVQCHGVPGVAALVQGLTPAPPNLLAAGRRNDPAEVFLKVTNGIAGTGMPAFGNILSDQSRWSLAAFLHHSRGISAGAFDALSTEKADTGQQGR